MQNIFTVREFVPSYQGVEGYYITYKLTNKTITVDGRTKPMNEYRYKKAIEDVKSL